MRVILLATVEPSKTLALWSVRPRLCRLPSFRRFSPLPPSRLLQNTEREVRWPGPRCQAV